MSTIFCIFVRYIKNSNNMERFCVNCGKVLTTERKFCKECQKAKKREYAKSRYRNMIDSGNKSKRYGEAKCIVCGKTIIKNRKTQILCYECFLKTKHKTVDNYNSVKRTKDGRSTLGRQVIIELGLKLNDMVVHHLDENPNNNSYNNLLILNKSNHAKLHRFLEKNWSLLLKNNSSNLENCWNSLRVQLTTTWLETMSVKVLKITEIGQSAAEPLNNEYCYLLHEEGSETMYQASKDNNIYDEDIVQTQNT